MYVRFYEKYSFTMFIKQNLTFQIEWLVSNKLLLNYVLMMEPARHTIHPTRMTQKLLLLYRSDNFLESLSTHVDLENCLNSFKTNAI